MAININTNLNALIAGSNIKNVNNQLKVNLTRLSTGLRVNSAADDAAGLARANQLSAQSRGIQSALRNTNDGTSALEVADSGASQIGDILARMKELAISGANGLVSDEGRAAIDAEFGQLREELDRIAGTTEFDGKKLLDGSTPTISLQVGFNSGLGDKLDVEFSDLSSGTLSGGLAAGIGTQELAQSAIDDIDAAISKVNEARTSFGAISNRIGVVVENLNAANVNYQAAESRIRDLDYASETANLTRNSILEQASIAIQAQANLQPQSALKLLG